MSAMAHSGREGKGKGGRDREMNGSRANIYMLTFPSLSLSLFIAGRRRLLGLSSVQAPTDRSKEENNILYTSGHTHSTPEKI